MNEREDEGHLALINRRLIFGPARHGILIDLPTKEIEVPVTIAHKFTMARLPPVESRSPTHPAT